MNLSTKNKLFLILLFWINQSLAQSELHLVNIGDFTTTEGNIIKNCKIGYRTVGKLNADKSNVVLWPSWFKGTSVDIVNSGALNNTIDTTGLYIILVDALANGVSSSPSNTPDFPAVSIRDMVNSQYDLLVNYLKIDHIYLVLGMSLGGIQTYEWLVAYPEFMEKAIPIIGAPKLSFYDILFWQTQVDLIEEAGSDEKKLDFAIKKAYDMHYLNMYTPSFFARTQSPDSVKVFMNKEYAKISSNAGDYLAQLKAIIQHDIYTSSNSSPDKIKNVIKADILVIVAQQDHMVSPTSSISFSKAVECELLELTSDCGHMAIFCESEKVQDVASAFLE